MTIVDSFLKKSADPKNGTQIPVLVINEISIFNTKKFKLNLGLSLVLIGWPAVQVEKGTRS